MSSTQELLRRINSVATMKQITQTMKFVAVAKLAKTKIDLERVINYKKQLLDIVNEAFMIVPIDVQQGKDLVITISSDKGFCGAFNNNICKRTQSFLQKHKNNVDVISIGKKINMFLSKHGYKSEFKDLFGHYNIETLQAFANEVIDKHDNYSSIYLIYNSYNNNEKEEHKIPHYQLIKKDPSNILFDQDNIITTRALLRKMLVAEIMSIIIESVAQENNTRMVSMSKATDNAEILEKSLRISYNQLRQATITNEIIEITNGAMALK